MRLAELSKRLIALVPECGIFISAFPPPPSLNTGGEDYQLVFWRVFECY